MKFIKILYHLYFFGGGGVYHIMQYRVQKRKTEKMRFPMKCIYNLHLFFFFSLSLQVEHVTEIEKEVWQTKIRTLEPFVLYRTQAFGQTTQGRQTDLKKPKDTLSFQIHFSSFQNHLKIQAGSTRDRSLIGGDRPGSPRPHRPWCPSLLLAC